MSQINCYLPIKLCITGRLSDAQLEQLSETLVRALLARIAFAERTVNPGHAVSETSVVEEARESADASRFEGLTYQIPIYDNEGRSGRVSVIPTGPSEGEVAEPGPELPLLSDFQDYAFFFAGGAYGRAAEEYIREFFPDHHRFRARSFEEMFQLLLNDIRRRTREAGRRQRVSEIVIVTHANAEGGMKIPLTQDNRRRTFSPSDLADLQQEFRQGLHRRFRAARREVVAALDESTRIVVRGCNVGQSQEALDALRAFFGGSPPVFAPRGYQGFEVVPIGRGSFLRSAEEAFEFLIQQGYLPAEQRDLPAAEKRRYIHQVFGGQIPAEFFLMSEEDSRRLRQLPVRQRLGGGEAENYMIRPNEQGACVGPSAGEFWGMSAPLDEGDAELDSLSMAELEARARLLRSPYRPQNAPMLLRLQNAWQRRSGEAFLRGELPSRADDDPLAGLPDPRIFGDSNLLASDAARYPRTPSPDIFETETLRRRTLTTEERARVQDFSEAERTVEAVASAGLSLSGAPGFGSRGRVDRLPNGICLWNFGNNSPRLRPQFHVPLQQLAQQALANPLLRIDINGHTDSSGGPLGNEGLSEARALAVWQFLIDRAVPASHMRTRGSGESNLIAPERRANGEVSPEGMARNRRVEIRLTNLGGQTVDEESLNWARGQGRTLGTQARPEGPPGSSIDWYTVGGLFTDSLSALDTLGIVVSPALELLGLVSPILSIIGLIDSLNTATGQQERGAKRLGIVLGLESVSAIWSRSDDLGVNITAGRLEGIVHNDWWLERRWLSQITYSYPLGPEGAIENMRDGLAQVAIKVNQGMRVTERYFRHRLEQTQMTPQDIATVYDAEIQRLRRAVLEAMLREGFRALNQ